MDTLWQRDARASRSVAAGVSALAMVLLGHAQAQTIGPLQQITNKSPFIGCTADQRHSQPGTNYLNTEIEPNIAINPVDPSNLLTGYL
jgi:hypothetical protein